MRPRNRFRCACQEVGNHVGISCPFGHPVGWFVTGIRLECEGGGTLSAAFTYDASGAPSSVQAAAT